MTYTDDELIKAALIEDDEDKRLREEEEKSAPEDQEATPSDEADAPEPEETESEEDEPDDLDKPEVEEQPKAETDEEADKPSRKERREAKKQAWLDSVRKEQRVQEQEPHQQSQQPTRPQPQEQPYQPIDYRNVDELNERELEQDRQTYAEIQRRNGIDQGRQSERYVAEQQNFWRDVQHEAEILQYDPEFKFLDEKNPDTFDPDLTADLNEKYLEFAGHNPENNTVRRTDISYEKFVRKEMSDRRAWAERLAAESTANLQETKANAGLRPGGGNRKSGLGQLKPGDISKMSDEQLAKYEDEIDRQILSAYE